MPRLTKRIVEAAAAGPKEYMLWDGDIPGFGLRVMRSGAKTYLVQYRAGTRSRRMSLGPHGVITPDQARTQAISILAAVRNGADPAADRRSGRTAITVTELAARFDREHICVRLRASTAKEYRRNLRRFILPALGRLKLVEVSRSDVAKFHFDLRHIPYQANRCLEVISKMFNLAEMWGLRSDGTNPRRHIRKYPETKRERFLNAAEIQRIGQALTAMEHESAELPSAIAAVRLLILTGCRLNEIMTLQWDYVDFQAAALKLPDSKTGAKVVRLGEPALEVIRGIRRVHDNPWIITGTLPCSHLSDLQPFWQRLRCRADLADVRLHDLRHTFASAAVAMGESLPMIGKLLGHSQVQTTARYAHLAADPVKGAANNVAQYLFAALTAS